MNFSRRMLRQTTVFGLSAVASLSAFSLWNGNEKFYSHVAMPIVHTLADGEQAHNLAVQMAKNGLTPKSRTFNDQEILRIKVLDREFENPIGCAAGFDKGGEAINGLFKIGFGFVEIGTITPLPQFGNPKPRVFRLYEDKAVINRYGFNSEGHKVVLQRVKEFKEKNQDEHKILGINIGKNKTSQDSVKDYLEGLKIFAKYADYITINISSPNTPGLRSLQNKNELEKLIDPLLEMRNQLNPKLPILLKIAPDLDEIQMQEIAQIATRKGKCIDGLIISNTTIERPSNLKNKSRHETGGLSGRPLKNHSTQVLQRMYELTGGKVTLIGVGGIENGRDALEKIKAGASLIQIYTAMVYQGPVVVDRIRRELIQLLKEEGYSSVSEAVGANFKTNLQKTNLTKF